MGERCGEGWCGGGVFLVLKLYLLCQDCLCGDRVVFVVLRLVFVD